jgi:probable HAF family extracellular repeat protein
MFTGALHTAGMDHDHAFIYNNGTVQDLGNLPGANTAGNGINAAGQVVGEWCCNGPYGGAFYYSGGVRSDLGPLDTTAAAINDAGVAVGGMLPPTSTYHAYMYSGGVMTDLGTPDGYGSFANGINNGGEIVGQEESGKALCAVLWPSKGKAIDPNTVLEPNSGWSSLRWADDINNDGWIVGFGYREPESGASEAYLLKRKGP